MGAPQCFMDFVKRGLPVSGMGKDVWFLFQQKIIFFVN